MAAPVTAFGVVKKEAVVTMAALLLAPRATAEDVCAAMVIPDGGGSDFSALKLALFVGFICGAVSASVVIWIGRRLYLAATVEKKKEVKSVIVQSPVTYARHRQDPRFVPLSESAWGAW